MEPGGVEVPGESEHVDLARTKEPAARADRQRHALAVLGEHVDLDVLSSDGMWR